MAPKVSSSHAGAISWSWVPGFCGACGAPTSLWSCHNGDPPWLPLAPHSRLHLRLLWDFYAASLPTSCSLMQEAIRVGDLSALRAEAALLSLISRALGFTSLSASARRVAEICDLTDAGTPSPAWGPHHPLAAAELTGFSPLITSGAKWGVQQQQYQHLRQQQQQYAFSCSNHYSSGAAGGGRQLLERASVSGCRRSVSVVGGACSSNRALDMAGTRKGLADPGVPQPDIIQEAGARNSPSAEDCDEPRISGLSAPVPYLQVQQHHQCPAQRKENRHNREQEELAKDQQYGPPFSWHPPHRQQLQRQRLPLDGEGQTSYAHPGQREQRQEKNYAAADFDAQHSPVGAFGEAVAVCFMDLHVAKAKLAPLFQDGTVAAAEVAPAAAFEDVAAEETHCEAAQRSSFEGLQLSVRALAATAAAVSSRALATPSTGSSVGAEIAAIPTVAPPVLGAQAAIAKAKAALRHAVAWSRLGVDAVAGFVSFATPDAAVWLPSLRGTVWCAAAPRHIFREVGGKTASTVVATSSAASSSEAAAIATAQKRRTVWPHRAAVLLGQWLRTASPPGAAFGGSVPLLQLLRKVFLAVEVAVCRKWDSCLYLVNRLARQLAATLQQVLRLLYLWGNQGVVELVMSASLSPRPGGSCSISTGCRERDKGHRKNSRRRSRRPWTTPEGLRPRGSTLTCYWSPMENSPGLCSPKKPAESLISDPLLRAPQKQGKEQAQFIEQQFLQHRLQVGLLRSPSESATLSNSSYVAFPDPAAPGKPLSGTMPVMPVSGLDHVSRHREGRLWRGNCFRGLPKVGVATRAAAAGAAAAAATASWSAGISQFYNISSQEVQRDVSFQIRNDETVSTHTPLQTATWGCPKRQQHLGLAHDRGAQPP